MLMLLYDGYSHLPEVNKELNFSYTFLSSGSNTQLIFSTATVNQVPFYWQNDTCKLCCFQIFQRTRTLTLRKGGRVPGQYILDTD